MQLARLTRRVHQNHCNFPECSSVQSCARTVTESCRCGAGRSVTREKKSMEKLFALALSLSLLGGLSPVLARATDADSGSKKHPKAAEARRTLRKEMLEKYDSNKNGKLDKKERARISKEDQEKLEKAGLGRHAKKTKKADKKESSK
jgi:hypothetical protein